MLKSKKLITTILCIALLLNFAMPDFALNDESIESLNAPQASTMDYAVSTISELELEEYYDENADVDVSEDNSKDEIEINTEIETEVETKTEIETSSTTSEATFLENLENEINIKMLATFSEINTKVATNNNFGGSNSEETKSKKITKTNNKPRNGYISPGFTVDIVDKDYNSGKKSLYGVDSLPAKYDSREHTNDHGVCIIPPVRDQNPYGTCWSFGTIGAIETSLRSKNLITSEADEGADLSEAAMALFTIEGLDGVTDDNRFIDYPGVESSDFNCLNYDYYMNVMHIPRASMSFADSGGNEVSATLVASTYMGLVPEKDFPHTVENIKAINQELRTTGLDDSRKPYAFNKNIYEVLNVDYLSKLDRDSVKEAIMKQGSVAVGYYEFRDRRNCHEYNGEWYYLVPLKACKINDDGSCGEETILGQNHAVTIVGWDDSVPRDKFYYDGEIYEDRDDYVIASYSVIEDSSGMYYPTYENENAIKKHSDGAWLIRNSWGDDNNMAKGGYFWIPYDTLNFDDIITVVDAAESNTYLYNYHYDTSANTSTYNYDGPGYLANIFQVSPDIDQVLDAVNIAWKSANFDYEIYIYTNNDQMSNPQDGTLMLSQTVHNGSAGIKTVELDKSVLLNKGTYFSIIVKPKKNEIHMFCDYTYADPNSDRFYYNEVHYGESWKNDNGTWVDLNATPIIVSGDKIYGASPRIRGLTNEARVITFDPGTGAGNMEPQGAKVGSTVKIDSNKFTKAGYVFYKWIDNNGNEYDNGAEITLNDNITLTAEWKESPSPSPTPTPTPKPSSNSDGGGSSSGGSGGGPIVVAVTNSNQTKSTQITLDSSQIQWEYNPLTNKFNLNININGQIVKAVNGFYAINNIKTMIVNSVQTPILSQDIYYFDLEGAMVTGFVKTADGKTYFFEDAKTQDEGKMVIGWKLIQGVWYYFNPDGSMLVGGA